MAIGRYYLRDGKTLAAVGRFRAVIDRHQTTSHTPEALYRLVECYITLGLMDEAKRNGAVLGYNYPGDPWYADAYKLLTSKGYRPAVEPKVYRVLKVANRSAHALLQGPVDVSVGDDSGEEPPPHAASVMARPMSKVPSGPLLLLTGPPPAPASCRPRGRGWSRAARRARH